MEIQPGSSQPLLPGALALLVALLAGLVPQGARGAFAVTNTSDAGPGSLRNAILAANATPGSVIQFAIPGSGVHVIMPLSALPTVSATTGIDGLTQPGASCAAWPPTLLIELDGSAAGDTSGLVVAADDTLVQGLIVHSFQGAGIEVASADQVEIRCNFIGTDATGTLAQGNAEDGVLVSNSVDSNVGGVGVPYRNLISGNGGDGVEFANDSHASEAIGNYIGTDATGMAAVPNVGAGVRVQSSDVTVGGQGLEAGNLISGNQSVGILLGGSFASGDLVFGNRIGTNAVGEPVLPNASGVSLSAGAHDSMIGSPLLPGLGNVIAGNTGDGVDLFNGDDTVGNSIRANSIFENGHLGIEIDGFNSPPTPNDAGDADEGPNRIQNFPEVVSVVWNDGGGTLDLAYGVPTDPTNASYPLDVDFYLADADGQEGAVWLAADSYAAADFAAGTPRLAQLVPAAAVAPGDVLVATATDAAGNTSEFSTAVTVPEPSPRAGGEGAMAACLALSAIRRRRAGSTPSRSRARP